jgi:hypothetical protein
MKKILPLVCCQCHAIGEDYFNEYHYLIPDFKLLVTSSRQNMRKHAVSKKKKGANLICLVREKKAKVKKN